MWLDIHCLDEIKLHLIDWASDSLFPLSQNSWGFELRSFVFWIAYYEINLYKWWIWSYSCHKILRTNLFGLQNSPLFPNTSSFSINRGKAWYTCFQITSNRSNGSFGTSFLVRSVNPRRLRYHHSAPQIWLRMPRIIQRTLQNFSILIPVEYLPPNPENSAGANPSATPRVQFLHHSMECNQIETRYWLHNLPVLSARRCH